MQLIFCKDSERTVYKSILRRIILSVRLVSLLNRHQSGETIIQYIQQHRMIFSTCCRGRFPAFNTYGFRPHAVSFISEYLLRLRRDNLHEYTDCHAVMNVKRPDDRVVRLCAEIGMIAAEWRKLLNNGEL